MNLKWVCERERLYDQIKCIDAPIRQGKMYMNLK